MPIFHAIAAMSENRVIGAKGKIPWHIADDFRWFKHKTMGDTLLMGRKTFESIGQPLPGRRTVVLSRTMAPAPGIEVYPDVAQLTAKLEAPFTFSLARVWVCGGEQIYREMLRSCCHLYLTRVKRQTEGDTFFPAFEDAYTFESVIHETDEFRVERWLNEHQGWRPASSTEEWPL